MPFCRCCMSDPTCDPKSVVVQPTAPQPWPTQGPLVQQITACTPEELSHAFTSFWKPLWTRDKPDDSVRDWEDFHSTLHECPLPALDLHLDPFVEEVWIRAVRKLSSRKATGVCGWAPADLKLLPDRAIGQLCRVFHKATSCGLPRFILQARVCVLSKAANPIHIRQSRPIVVFSALYRLWASVSARLALSNWSQHFPESVAGSMPSRSVSDVTLSLQHEVELCLKHHTLALGFTVDIIKCFNQIGWKPAVLLLRKLRFPEDSLRLWEHCMPNIVRYPSFQGSLGEGVVASNGTPEGDPISVAAMPVLCLAAAEFFKPAEATFSTYVDNWSWRASTVQTMTLTVPRVVRWLHSAKLPVDRDKSYAWGTSREFRLWWSQSATTLLPAGVKLQVVTAVKELGVALRFGVASTVQHRDGLARLKRIQAMNRTVKDAAALIQRSAWPAILHGLEGHLLPEATFARLRGQAARALVGPHATLSPHLALSALTTAVQDPQLYCLERQLQLLRKTCQRHPVCSFLCWKSPPPIQEAAYSGRGQHWQAPFGALTHPLAVKE